MKTIDKLLICVFVLVVILAIYTAALSIVNTRRQVIIDQKSELIKRDAERHEAWLAQWRR